MRTINWILRGIFKILCRIDRKEFDKIPITGPLILIGNHINFLDVPLMMAHLDNPAITGLAKRETWDNPFLKFLFNQWKAIPIDRDNIDREAVRMALEALAQGKLLAISPEGTRSGDGILQQGKPGVIALAIQSKSPMQAIGLYGQEYFRQNYKRLRRTEIHVTVGKPFRINPESDYRSREVRQAIVDEIMYKLAECLPEKYRGYYQFEGKVDYKHLISL